MKGKDFFELEARGETFVLTLKAHVNGFKCGDVLVCRQTSSPIPGNIVILERDDCGRWPMLYDEAGPELAAGARLIGQALCVSRALDREVSSMERKQESPSTVCRPSKGSKLKETGYKGIAIIRRGQAENLATILAWQPLFEMVPAALLVAIAGGSLWVP